MRPRSQTRPLDANEATFFQLKPHRHSTLCAFGFSFLAPLRERLFLAGGAEKEKRKAQRVE
jgi:hypothetical protein